LYYFAYAKHIQKFSDEEQTTLLEPHVMNNNRRRRRSKKVAKNVPVALQVIKHQYQRDKCELIHYYMNLFSIRYSS